MPIPLQPLLNRILWLLAAGGVLSPAYAGIKVGDNPTTIGASSLLELESTDKALLVSRVANTTAITTPASGMLVYDLSTECFKSYENNAWSSCLGLPPVGAITALSCSTTTSSGTLTNGSAASSVSDSVPYTGGNGGSHSGQTVTSTGVTGLTATLAAGSFATGAGSLTYTITGTPASSGAASFALNIGGQSCTLTRTVVTPVATICPVNMGGGVTKNWLCHNLGADTTADPHNITASDAWRLNGAYIAWGQRGPNITGDSRIDWQTAPNDGSIGFAAAPTASNPNASVASWTSYQNTQYSWRTATGTKTANDPCPLGYRVPTISDYSAVKNNNTASITGLVWASASSTNYGSALHYGPNSTTRSLTLPATGQMAANSGAATLEYRGGVGRYQTSGISTTAGNINPFYFDQSMPTGFTGDVNNKYKGMPVRCIAE